MFMSIKPAQHSVSRRIAWFTLYIFYFQMLSCSGLAYISPILASPKHSSSENTLLDTVMGFFVSTANAAETTEQPDDGLYLHQAAAGSSVLAAEGSGGVSSTMGAYGYSYPIKVPPGRGGLSPKLALTYSSMATNGWLGLGWGLSIDSIERSTKKGKPVYNDSDTFNMILNGTSFELVQVENGYRMKKEGLFLRILKTGDSWDATDKSGTHYYFGTNSDSRQTGPEGTIKWCLDRIEDPNKNEIIFTYDKDVANNQLYLQQISYDVNNFIVFESEPADRPDVAPDYRTYFKVRTTRRLQRIKVFQGGQADTDLVRRYELSYLQDPGEDITKQSILETITQYGNNGTALPPVHFDYTTSQAFYSHEFSLKSSGTWPSWGENIYTGDFTGDGKTDFVATAWSTDIDGWKLYESQGENFNLISEGTGLDKNSLIHQGDFDGDGRLDMLTRDKDGGPCTLYTSTGSGFTPTSTNLVSFKKHGPKQVDDPVEGKYFRNSFYIGDFNGDGRSDVLSYYESYIKNGHEFFPYVLVASYFNLYISTENGFDLKWTKESSNPAVTLLSLYNPYTVRLGDFNGDGKTDLFVAQTIQVELTQEPEIQYVLYLSAGESLDQIFLGDESAFTPVERRFIGDFNNDGRTDILTTSLYADQTAEYDGYRLHLSTGSGFVLAGEGDLFGVDESIHTADFNGDGRTDVLVTDNVTGGQFSPPAFQGYKLYISTGNGFQPGFINGDTPYDHATNTDAGSRYYLGDYNGDGCYGFMTTANIMHTDWTGYKLYQTSVDQSATVDQNLHYLLGSITDTLNTITEITYMPSTIWPKEIKNINGDIDDTYRFMPRVIPTVSEVSVHENGDTGHTDTKAYVYEGGDYNIANREFRGFGKVTVTNTATDISSVNYYYQDATYHGRIKESYTRIPNGSVIGKTINTWDMEPLDGVDRTFVYLRTATTTSYEDDGIEMLATITTHYGQPDGYGNISTEEKIVTNHHTGDVTTRFVRTEFHNDTVNWIMGQPRNIRTDLYDPGPSNPGIESEKALRETRMEYYQDRPWLLQHTKHVFWQEEEHGVMAEQEITTSYDYDTYGNTIRISNPRNPAWGTTMDYSYSDGMFPNLTTNARGHTIYREFDPQFGVIVKETVNPQSVPPGEGEDRQTTSHYDEFGRQKKIEYPDDSTKDYEYKIESGKNFIRVSSSMMPTVTSYYDNLDRIYKEVVDDNTTKIITRTYYDSAGRLWRETLPHHEGAAEKYTEYNYETNRGRIALTTHSDGTKKRVSYQGFKQVQTTETAAGEVISKKEITNDGMGYLRKVVEYNDLATGNAGTTEYDYDLFGNLIWMQGPMGNQIQIYYDDLGRKISIDDPYMGSWEYRYDAAGNLEWQKDADGRITEMTYDELNRLDTIDYLETGRQIKYDYDEDRVGFYNTGALTTITATEPGAMVNSIQYNYDKMGRNEEVTRNIDGAEYTTRSQYDLAGRVVLLTYPGTGPKIEYTYHGMGYLERVYEKIDENNKKELARYQRNNALGQIDSLTYGNGTTTSYTYNPASHRLDTLVTTGNLDPNTPGVLQDLKYVFDELGNLKTITDRQNDASYEFDYDDNSRLTRAMAICPNDPGREYDQGYTYDLAGNMAAKTGKGAFQVLEWQDESKHIRPSKVLYSHSTTGVGQRSVEYNQDNKPTKIKYGGQTSQLIYNGEGNRVKKISGSQTTVYVGEIYEIRGGQSVAHIYADGRRIASVTNNQILYTHEDHLGSTGVVTNGDGVRVEEIGYLPFGATLFRKEFNNGTWASAYQFTGQEYDAEYALYNYNARLYDPVMGRFITPDTIVPDWTDPQSLNRYAYCRNNPLKYVDPSGNLWLVSGAAVSWFTDKFDDIRSSLDPIKIWQDGGAMGLLAWSFEPVNHSFSYTHAGGFATGGGGNYYVLSYGGGWQQRGPNHGFYGYVGLGYRWKSGVGVGVYAQHNFTQNTTSFGVNVGYTHRSGAYGGLDYNFTNGSWSASAGYTEPGLLQEHKDFWEGLPWELYTIFENPSPVTQAFGGVLLADASDIFQSYRLIRNEDLARLQPGYKHKTNKSYVKVHPIINILGCAALSFLMTSSNRIHIDNFANKHSYRLGPRLPKVPDS